MGDHIQSKLQLISRLVNEFSSPTTGSAEKIRLGKQLKQQLNITTWKDCLYFLSSTVPTCVSMFSLAAISASVREVVVGGMERRMDMYNSITTFLSEQCHTLPTSIRDRLVELSVDIANSDWPHFLPVFMSQVTSLMTPASSLSSQLLGLTMVMAVRLPVGTVSSITELTAAILTRLELVLKDSVSTSEARPALLHDTTQDPAASQVAELSLRCLGHIFSWCSPSPSLFPRLLNVLLQYAASNTSSLVSVQCYNVIHKMSIIVIVQDECKQLTVQCLLILAVNHGDNFFDDFATSNNNQSDPSEEPLSSESGKFICGECGKQFETKEKLRYHRRTHAQKECPYCLQMFSSTYMSRHAKKSCPMKPKDVTVPVTPVTNNVKVVQDSMETTEDTAIPGRILEQQSADQGTSEAIGDTADTASSTQYTATVDLGASSSLDMAASSSASSFAPATARDMSDSAPNGQILDTGAPALTAQIPDKTASVLAPVLASQDTSDGAAQLLDMAATDLTEQETSSGTAQILDTEQDGEITIQGKIFFKECKIFLKILSKYFILDRLFPGDILMFVNSVPLGNASLDTAVQALKGAAQGTVLIGVSKPLPVTESQMTENTSEEDSSNDNTEVRSAVSDMHTDPAGRRVDRNHSISR